MVRSTTPSRPPLLSPCQIALALLIVVTCAIEIFLTAADLGLIATPYLRYKVYTYTAFFAPILHGARANYDLQPLTMFVTYAFVHGGWLHLLVNMLTLGSVGPGICKQVGPLRFLMAYLLTAIGGAACYGLLATDATPMVGASGALFGLIGIWICWGYQERRHYGEGMREIYRAVGILVAYNAVFFVLLSGHLAWQTHLGGFVAGWLIGLWWGRPIYRRQRRSA